MFCSKYNRAELYAAGTPCVGTSTIIAFMSYNIVSRAIKLKLSTSPHSKFLSTNPKKDYSFTVSYLINSCGLSPESAFKASKYVNFDNPDKPNNVLDFLKQHGFSQTQIFKLVKSQPMLLSVDPSKAILPKVEFFMSKGASQSEIADLFSKFPSIMKSRLDRRIVPTFSLLKDVFRCDKVVLTAAKRYMSIFTRNIEKSLIPNVKILRECGVPESVLFRWFKFQPRTFLYASQVLERAVKEVRGKGFDPSKQSFVLAVLVLSQLGETGWKRKVGVYEKWGWSEELVDQNFRAYPWIMMTSEDKITRIMDFFVNEMGWDSLLIVKFPQIMNLSLEKRVVPRGCVIKVLMSKGLLKRKYTMRAFFGSPGRVFVERYIKPFEKEVPELVEIYKGNVGLSNACTTRRT